MFELNPDVSDIAKRYAVGHEGVDLLVLGAVQTAADGCACPESVLLKSLVPSGNQFPRRNIVHG
jgi:CO dehydrogenase maturation factor